MNSGVFMKSLDIFCIYVILNLWIGGYSQQTIHNWIANNEWSGAGFPKLRLPGPCEQVFGFSRSLCSCGSFLLPCSHGFRQSFSRSRKGGPMYCITHWNEQSAGYPWAAMAPRIWLCMLGVSQAVSFEGFLSGTPCLDRRLRRFCEVCGPEALFLWPARCCSYSRVQANERSAFPGLWIRLTSLLQNVKFSNGWAFWHARVTWI